MLGEPQSPGICSSFPMAGGRAASPCPSAVLGGLSVSPLASGCVGCRGWHSVAGGSRQPRRQRCPRAQLAELTPPTPRPPRAPRRPPTPSSPPRPSHALPDPRESKSCSPGLGDWCPSTLLSPEPTRPWHGWHAAPAPSCCPRGLARSDVPSAAGTASSCCQKTSCPPPEHLMLHKAGSQGLPRSGAGVEHLSDSPQLRSGSRNCSLAPGKGAASTWISASVGLGMLALGLGDLEERAGDPLLIRSGDQETSQLLPARDTLGISVISPWGQLELELQPSHGNPLPWVWVKLLKPSWLWWG